MLDRLWPFSEIKRQGEMIDRLRADYKGILAKFNEKQVAFEATQKNYECVAQARNDYLKELKEAKARIANLEELERDQQAKKEEVVKQRDAAITTISNVQAKNADMKAELAVLKSLKKLKPASPT